MKRTILLLLSIVSILSLSSCGDDDKPVVQSIEISKSEASVKVGEKITLTVSHSPADLPAPEYEWNSSDETIATVENGIVYGKSVGEVTISVSSFNLKLKDICKVTVTPIEATDIKLSESEKTMTTGESFRLEYTIELQDDRWIAFRNFVLTARGKRCEKCGSDKHIQIHHPYYIKGRAAWEYNCLDVIVLCSCCHEKEHHI